MSDREDQEQEQDQDEELKKLREMKSKLLHRAKVLKEELEAWDTSGGNISGRTEKDFLPPTNEFHDLFIRNDDRRYVNKKCVAVSSFVMGIKFNAVDKKWISDHKFLYTANVKSKVLEFFLEVTVDVQDPAKSIQILDTVCHFVNLRKCYFLEITPWVHQFTVAKDTSNLFSAVSDYTEYNVTRTKILRKFQTFKIASVEEYTEDDGGIVIRLHAKNDADFVYFEIRWVLQFVESLWQIDNFFAIQSISAGSDFLAANNELLQSFCKCRIKKADLENMWDRLCSEIEQDDISQSISGTVTS